MTSPHRRRTYLLQSRLNDLVFGGSLDPSRRTAARNPEGQAPATHDRAPVSRQPPPPGSRRTADVSPRSGAGRDPRQQPSRCFASRTLFGTLLAAPEAPQERPQLDGELLRSFDTTDVSRARQLDQVRVRNRRVECLGDISR
jgi:hypothetical protein